jgi:hypothetical protein
MTRGMHKKYRERLEPWFRDPTLSLVPHSVMVARISVAIVDYRFPATIRMYSLSVTNR